MEYVANYLDVVVDPAEWAQRREEQGWDVVSVADHFFTDNRPFPHVWVTTGAMAAATERVTITTGFVNNLVRSPVEVAQASLMMQAVSGGRFELGLGAGWARGELIDAGLDHPEPAVRAGMFAEAAQIIRSITRTGACRLDGEHYRVDIEGLGPLSDHPPPIVASVGGPRTVREVTPHCDRVEIKAASPSTRDGRLDLAGLAAIPDAHLVEMIERVRAVDADIPIGMFVLCDVGDDTMTRGFASALGDGLYSRFTGPPAKVIEGLAWLEEVGVSRAQISPLDDTSFDRLAAELLA